MRRGIAALVAGDAREAVNALEAGFAQRPFDPVTHFDLAVAHRLRGDLPRALAHARVATELAPSAPAHALFGVHLQLAGARDRARQHFERALALEPTYRLAAMYLGLLDRELGRHADALAGLERSLAPGSGALPPLVAERVRGQLFDLRRSPGPATAAATALCSVAVVTEIMLPDGATAQLEPDTFERTTPDPAPARACDAAEIAQLLHGASNVVALTGAGASAACGLATRKQLWQRYDRDAAVSAVGVRRNPTTLWAVVRDFLGPGDHPPGAVHAAIARLPRLAAIVTQNVDGLHQRAALAGREAPVFELHGTLERLLCSDCGARAPHPARHYVRDHARPPPCPACGAALRPDVVLFGEQIAPRTLAAALRAVEGCDLLLVVGCALDVAPASELPRLAAARGATVVELKLSPSRVSDAVGSALALGPAELTLPAIYARLAELEPLPPLPPAPAPRAVEPFVTLFTLPAIGEQIVEGVIARWVPRVGDVVAQGDVIAEVETDKVCVEIEAPFGGVVRALLVEHGEAVPVGAPIADIEPLAPPPARPVEVHEAPLALLADFGPYTAAVRREVLSLAGARWLLPEGPRDALEARIRALAAAHCRALDPAAPPPEVWFTDDAREALARWRGAWLPAGSRKPGPFDPATAAWREALAAAERRLTREVDRAPSAPLARLVVERVERRIKELHGDRRLERRSASAIEALALRRLSGLAARGQDVDPPCPFAPLLAIWAAGVWPFVLPNGALGAYLPFPPLKESRTHSPESALYALRDFVGLDRVPE